MNLPKSQIRPKKRAAKFCAVLLGTASVLATAAAKADTTVITTIAPPAAPPWNGRGNVGFFTEPTVLSPVYGQTFTAPVSSSLKTFQFFTRGSFGAPLPILYNAYLYRWDAARMTPIGGPVRSLEGLEMKWTESFNNGITLNVNSPRLEAGKQYIMYFNAVKWPGRVPDPDLDPPQYEFGLVGYSPEPGDRQPTTAYEGGEFVYTINGSEALTWSDSTASPNIVPPELYGDLAFVALFGTVLFPSTAQPYADIQSVSLDALKNQRDLIFSQAGNCDQLGWVVYDSDASKDPTKPKKHQSLCVFAEGAYATGTINGTDTLGGYNTYNASSAYGIEWRPSKQWAVGAAYGYGTANLVGFNLQETTAYINSNINSFNAYGVYRPDKNWRIAALAGYSNFSYTGSKIFLGDTANSSFSANGYTAALQGSYDIILNTNYNNQQNPLNPVRLKPLVGIAWGGNQQAGFSETGQGALLNVQGQAANSLMATVGAYLEAPIPLNKTKTAALTPRVGVAYQYDFLANQDGNKSITAALQNDASTSFTEIGLNRGADSIYLELGADLQINPQVFLYAGVNYQAFTNGDQIGYQGGVRMKF